MENGHKPGRTAARFLRALAIGGGNDSAAKAFIEQSRWVDEKAIKSAVDAMTMGGSPGLAYMVGEDFVGMVYPRSIVGRLASLRRIPLRTSTIRQTGGTRAYWVKEKSAKPVAAAAFERDAAMESRKVVGLTVITEELARESEAEAIIQRDLGNAVVAAMDASFIDPDNAGVTDEEPTSVTNGATTIASTGDLADDADAAIEALEGSLTTASWVMHPRVAARAGLKFGGLGVAADLGALGGTLAGLPVITSESVPYTSDRSPLVLMDADGIELGGADQARLLTSTEASILMNDAPGSGAQQLVSMWQTNSIALMGEIFVNWRRVRPGSVVVITDATYQGS